MPEAARRLQDPEPGAARKRSQLTGSAPALEEQKRATRTPARADRPERRNRIALSVHAIAPPGPA